MPNKKFGDLPAAGALTGGEILAVSQGGFSKQSLLSAQKAFILTDSVIGPASAVSGHVAVFSGTSGKLVADSGFSLTQGTVTSVSVSTANGVSGSVATSTTTPAITLTLGAITPASVVASGNVTGAALVPSSATVPTDGMYLAGADILGWSTASAARMTLDASGNLILGMSGAAAYTAGQFTTSNHIRVFRSAGAGVMVFCTSGGTLAAPTQVAANANTGRITAFAFNDSTWGTLGPQINFFAAEAQTTTAQGSYITFTTQAIGATASTERYRISPAGALGIGGANYGNSGDVLTSGGSAAAPAWAAPAAAAAGTLTGATLAAGVTASSLTSVGSLTALTVAGTLISTKARADQSYSLQIPTTGFAITVANTVQQLILKPAGTLATGTVTMPAAPVDGQIVNIATSQTITTLTVSANSGQSMANAFSTTLSAGTGISFIYNLSGTTWFRRA